MYALDLAADPLFLKTGRPFYVCARVVHLSEKVDQYSAARCGLFPPSDFFHILVQGLVKQWLLATKDHSCY